MFIGLQGNGIYTSFRKVLKALKLPSGGLKIIDRTVFFEFFDINSIERDSTFFVLMSESLRDSKFSNSWMYMFMPSPRPLL